MWSRRTTICCSAFALGLVSCAASLDLVAPAPLSLFPVHPAWTLPLNRTLAARPAYNGSRGYFPLDSGRIAAYDLARGSLVWLAEARPLSTPAAGGGLLYLALDGSITALSEADGAVVWTVPAPEPLAQVLVWDNGWLIAALTSGEVLAFRGADGHVIWRRQLGTPAHAPPSLAADRVYLPLADGRIAALRVDTGDPVWERQLDGLPHDVRASDDRLYVGAADNYLYCLLAEDGRIDWRWPAGADVIGLPALDRERVYFVSLDNVLRALDRHSGNQHWKQTLPLRPTAGPLLAGNTVIVSGLGPVVRGYSADDGSAAGELPLKQEVAAAPHVVGGSAAPRIVVVTRDIGAGAVLAAFVRTIEPALAPVAPLPNPVTPATPTAPPPP